MPTIIKGQPPSAEVRQRLKDEGKPVMLAFSTGKDALAAWIALKNDGIEVVPVYLYMIPGMQFVEDTLKMYEDHFQTKIHQYPHALLFSILSSGTLQPPERLPTLAAAEIERLDYTLIWDVIAEDLGMEDSWRADGVRAADSIVRRASLTKHGVMKPQNKKVSVIADWLKSEVTDAIEAEGTRLSDDYPIWGRSFDGLDARFTGPLREHYPKDYELLERWVPLADLDIIRWERINDNDR